MIQCPSNQCFDVWNQTMSHFRQAIFHPRWYFRICFPFHQPVGLQRTESNSQHPLRNIVYCFMNVTDALNELGIPYIYIDSQIKDAPPLAFFGQNSHQSGYFAARMLMLLAVNDREIVIFRKIHEGVIGSNQQESREIGFRQYMQEHHPACNILELNLHADLNIEDSRMLDDFFREHPDVKHGITFNSKVYIIGEYLQQRRKSDFSLIGYDLLERNVTCLKEGTVSFLIAQQPELQGFNSIKTLCDHLIFRKEVTCTNYMPIDLLTKENIDYYHSK